MYRRRAPTIAPLLSTLWWVRVAPFGAPVVPDVNWMLIGSSGSNVASRSRSAWVATADAESTNASQEIAQPGRSPSPNSTIVRSSGSPARSSSSIAT